MTANADLAATVRVQADDAMSRRKILLTASVALGTTSTPAAAIRELRKSSIPAEVRDQAVTLIEALRKETA